MDEHTHLEHQLHAGTLYLIEADPILVPIIKQVGAAPLMLTTDYFWSLVSAIVSQQLSGAAATTIGNRLKALFSAERPLTPANVAAARVEELRGVGLSGQKASYVLDLASRVADGSLDLNALKAMDDEEIIARLLPVKGIGRWTAEMFLIFSLGRMDVLPVDDLGLKTAVQKAYGLHHLPKKPDLIDLAEPWRPYRTVATLYLWRSLDWTPGEDTGE